MSPQNVQVVHRCPFAAFRWWSWPCMACAACIHSPMLCRLAAKRPPLAILTAMAICGNTQTNRATTSHGTCGVTRES